MESRISMPNFVNHPATERATMLLLGDSGAGKTGSLASLANAGYKLRILDFDNGLDILRAYVDEDKLENISYQTCRDTLETVNAFQTGLGLMSHWKTSEEDLGKVTDWGPDTFLIVDSLSLMSEAALRRVLKREGKKPTDNPSQPQWGDAMRDIENILLHLTGNTLKCNIICTAHITYIEEGGVVNRPYPSVIGNKLPPKISRYFNTVCRIDVKPGKGGERVIRTVADHKMALKNTSPTTIPEEMPLDLAQLFKLLTKQ
jgi:hypothetical protein